MSTAWAGSEVCNAVMRSALLTARNWMWLGSWLPNIACSTCLAMSTSKPVSWPDALRYPVRYSSCATPTTSLPRCLMELTEALVASPAVGRRESAAVLQVGELAVGPADGDPVTSAPGWGTETFGCAPTSTTPALHPETARARAEAVAAARNAAV